MTQQSGPFRALVEEFKAGRVSRRDFLGHAAKLGVGLPVALFVLNHTDAAVRVSASGHEVLADVPVGGALDVPAGGVAVVRERALPRPA